MLVLSWQKCYGERAEKKNDDGEDVLISVFDDRIVMETYQENGFIRTNILHEDGTTEELFTKTTPY